MTVSAATARAQQATSTDHHRPAFHIRPPRGYLNDPNGPVVLGTTLHLYFQSRPTTDVRTPVEWGHASSDDLVRWTLHRPAMSPVPDGPDRDGCWSGNVVVDGDLIRAYYSGRRAEAPYQSVLAADSTDRGASFGVPTRAVPDPGPDEDVVMFRDPFVWWDPRSGWRMVVGAALADDRAVVRHYRSADLRTWERTEDVASLPRQSLAGEDTGTGWECPQVLTFGDVDVAIVGSWTETDGPGPVLSFPFGRPALASRVDHGPNFYAPSVLRHSPEGPLLFAWITEGRSAEWWHHEGWAGAISLARRVSQAPDGSLRSLPPSALDTLRQGSPVAADGATTHAQCEILVPAGSGRVRLRFGDSEWLDVVLDEDAGTLAVDRANASVDPRAHTGRSSIPQAFDPASGLPAARIIVDGSVVEVFTSAGRVLTTRVYPLSAPPWTVSAPAGAVIWQLDDGGRRGDASTAEPDGRER